MCRAMCWQASSTGLLVSACLPRKRHWWLCSGLSLQGCLQSKQPWKTEWYLSPKQRAYVFPDHKHNVSLWNNGLRRLLAALLHNWGFLKFRVSRTKICVHSIHLDCSPLPLWDLASQGNQYKHEANVIFCTVSKKVLCLWSKSLMSSASIYETMAG